MVEECVFCKIAKGEINQDKIFETDNFFAVPDKFPHVDGHTLVIPKKHYVTVLDIPDKFGSEMIGLIKKVAGRLLDEKKGDGFNLLMNNLDAAGQVVMHAHVHVIPRNEGDGVSLAPHSEKN